MDDLEKQAMISWAKHSSVSKDTQNKWNDLAQNVRNVWINRAKFYNENKTIIDLMIERYNIIWESASGLDAHSVESVRNTAMTEALMAEHI